MYKCVCASSLATPGLQAGAAWHQCTRLAPPGNRVHHALHQITPDTNCELTPNSVNCRHPTFEAAKFATTCGFAQLPPSTFYTNTILQRMSEPNPRLLERLFPGPCTSTMFSGPSTSIPHSSLYHRREVSAGAAGGGGNKVRGRSGREGELWSSWSFRVSRVSSPGASRAASRSASPTPPSTSRPNYSWMKRWHTITPWLTPVCRSASSRA